MGLLDKGSLLRNRFFLMIGDIFASFLILVIMVPGSWAGQGRWVFAFIPMVVLFSFLCEVYQPEKYVFKERLARSAIAALLSAAILVLLPGPTGRNPQMILGCLLLFYLLQSLWQVLFHRANGAPFFTEKVLVLGTDKVAHNVENLIQSAHGRYEMLGYVSTPLEGISVKPQLIRGSIEDIVDIAQESRVDAIVIAMTERRGNLPPEKLVNCKLMGVRILDYPSFYELVTGKIPVEHINPSWLVQSQGYMVTPFIRVIKKILDLFCSLILLALCLPFFPLIALAIKLDSPGPIFYTQERVGLNGKPFTIFKFRSMGTDSEAGTGAAWATENDPRVTGFGLFMRKTRIDELPQLFNVLKGDMSFIGPRPERPEFVEEIARISPYYTQRHAIKPGITGWAQVMYPYGASLGDAIEKLRYDLYYINHLSLFLDLLILFETVKIVLFRRGGR
ncbi:MAG: TIGR03013 family PEP-CTERM/XrtA system glycosyltransferase [Desulfobacterales bacterium]|nr:TIGR03013 family PEP-CTERM/XrtA system glycosyltransferase [Desulfobacterales bacterium]